MREDEELKLLRKRKDLLVKKVLQMRDKLQHKGIFKVQISVPENEDLEKLAQSSTQSTSSKELTDEQRFVVRLVDATQQATRISFQNVDKKWLRDTVWVYTSEVVMKIVTFELKLQVDLKDGVDHEVLDITCRFNEVPECYMQEILPWSQEIMPTKKLTHLMSAFSEYNDQCTVRERILDRLSKQKFMTVDNSSTGGHTIYIYSGSPKKAGSRQYLNVSWKMQFTPKSRTIDHRFTIEALETGFAKQHNDLLQDFCRKGLKKEDLERLWSELCTSVAAYDH